MKHCLHSFTSRCFYCIFNATGLLGLSWNEDNKKFQLFSVLWRCWLGDRKGIRPVKKTERWGAGVVICLEWGADLHMAQLMPLTLTVSCFSKIQIGFTFLVPVHLGSPGKGPLNGCVWVLMMMNTFYGNVDDKTWYMGIFYPGDTDRYIFCSWKCHGDVTLL